MLETHHKRTWHSPRRGPASLTSDSGTFHLYYNDTTLTLKRHCGISFFSRSFSGLWSFSLEKDMHIERLRAHGRCSSPFGSLLPHYTLYELCSVQNSTSYHYYTTTLLLLLLQPPLLATLILLILLAMEGDIGTLLGWRNGHDWV